MCTGISWVAEDHYFGRNLDLDESYGEEVVICPRNFSLAFRHLPVQEQHLAMIGMATVMKDYPLYFDAVNEQGLGMAGLNYPGNAQYFAPVDKKANVASFELIPWILGQAKSVKEARKLVEQLNITDDAFMPGLQPGTLHWLVSDQKESIVLEQNRTGLHVYDNPVGVLTNNPSFDMQLFNLNNYQGLQVQNPQGKFGPLKAQNYCSGLGSIGLPGDLSSPSRFVRAAFTKVHATLGATEGERVSQFFHLLASTAQVKGTNQLANGNFEYTIYSSCANATKGRYYYTTYQNPQINCVTLAHYDLKSQQLGRYPLQADNQINFQN